ncbi:hypothetical protein [Methylobacterium sp. P1-11]|uniref:hypothetical protein n=1 Tax=Methylobacterium sp. P1-11 TaxID=2024616 RepID=UPI0015632300|nr:hypothetical protein [Methylobacterium sp. P1-11]
MEATATEAATAETTAPEAARFCSHTADHQGKHGRNDKSLHDGGLLLVDTVLWRPALNSFFGRIHIRIASTGVATNQKDCLIRQAMGRSEF